jgi:hypothetical protein
MAGIVGGGVKDHVAAAHGRQQRIAVAQVASGVFHLQAVEHPGLAGSPMEGAHLPARLQAGADDVVADTAG